MEVHHHPSGKPGERKRFKEYFLEFLMLFLAVTLGFFAENIRENYSERKSAREYAQLLVNDLISDTVELNKTAHVLTRIIGAGDSLSAIIMSKMDEKNVHGKLYYYEYWSGWRWRAVSHDATLKQLESSGALRYLGHAPVIRKILDYDESLKIIALLESNFEDEKTENWRLVQKVFYQTYFDTLDNIKAAARDSSLHFSETGVDRLNKFLNNNYPLITNDKNMMIELSNWAKNSARSYKILLRDVSFAKEKATEAITALRDEYRFE